MVDMSSPPDIPKGTFFKAAEVCELVKVQPYVLRSWEVEFPSCASIADPDTGCILCGEAQW